MLPKNLPSGDFFYFIHFQCVATIAEIKYSIHLDTAKQLLYLQPICAKMRYRGDTQAANEGRL